MRTVFEGYRFAKEHAQKESKGVGKECLVLKSNIGGIVYCTINSEKEIIETDKVMGHYKNGEIVIK